MRKPLVFRGSARKKTNTAAEEMPVRDSLVTQADMEITGEPASAANCGGADESPCESGGAPLVELNELTDVKESLEELCDKLL